MDVCMKEDSKTGPGKMVIKSPFFGEMEVTPDLIYYFEDGLIGFEDLKRYILISEEKVAPFKWLQSVDEPALSFPILNPRLVDSDYKPGKKYTGTKHLSLFAIVTLKNKNNRVTINLRAPVVFDNEKRTGKQVILTSEKYATNYEIDRTSNQRNNG